MKLLITCLVGILMVGCLVGILMIGCCSSPKSVFQAGEHNLFYSDIAPFIINVEDFPDTEDSALYSMDGTNWGSEPVKVGYRLTFEKNKDIFRIKTLIYRYVK